MSAGEVWIATLADGTEVRGARSARTRLDGVLYDSDDTSYAHIQDSAPLRDPRPKIVEWRREGEPSRAQLIAALEAAEPYVAAVVDVHVGALEHRERVAPAVWEWVTNARSALAAIRTSLGVSEDRDRER